MSTCNFITQDNFPLFAYEYDNLRDWICPDCSTDEYGYFVDPVYLIPNRFGGFTCPECGCSTSAPEEDLCHGEGIPDERIQDWYDDTRADLADVNCDFQKWEIRLLEGYYSDCQLIAILRDVEDEYHMNKWRSWPEDPEEYAGCFEPYDEDADAVAVEWAKSEMPRVRQTMREFAKDHGFVELDLIGVFSNGEAVYREV